MGKDGLILEKWPLKADNFCFQSVTIYFFFFNSVIIFNSTVNPFLR